MAKLNIPMRTATEAYNVALNAEVVAMLAVARTGKAPTVVTPTEAAQIDHAERLAGIRFTESVNRAGSGGGALPTS